MQQLAEIIARNVDKISGRWANKVGKRLGLDHAKRPQLINEMPEVLTDLVESLKTPPKDWRSTSARLHARQRIGLGLDIGGLSEEFGIIGETILEITSDEGAEISAEETALMLRFLSRCTAESVTEFARLSNIELQRRSAEHFSFMAHELRTPLQAAQLALALVTEGTPASAGVDRLRASLSRLSSLIDNSLVDARLTAEPALHKEQTTASAIVADSVNYAADLAHERGIQLEVKVEDFDFDADQRLMVSALTNLIVNGVKFSHRGGQVVVKAALKEERVHFEVHDSCGGLPPGAASRMFQQFGQVGRDRSGFGLGLLIVKQAIEAHGGRVRVIDAPTKGCRMVMELPRRQSRHSRAALAPGRDESSLD